jgi:hypothetical protein
LRPDYASEPKETVCITSRLVLTLDAARNLVEAVGSMLPRVETEHAPIQKSIDAAKRSLMKDRQGLAAADWDRTTRCQPRVDLLSPLRPGMMLPH